jgi:signal transduction histidine kinase
MRTPKQIEEALQAEVLAIAEQEQRRIGQDLHDDLGQELTGVGLMAEALLDALEESGSPEAALAAKICARLNHACQRVRTLACDLIPVEVDAGGLSSALEELCMRIGTLNGIQARFECKIAVQFRDNGVATHLYRIAQEAIANAIKHGHARRVTVELSQSAGVTILEIWDDGIGILDESQRRQGMGLRIMQYRAGLVGASLEVSSVPDGGTRVICRI